ncbi:MAG: IPTL-CTERM sorting domain-containing protein [Bacteroidetes bacterium]|nr:IPTL-CTERM sorting domain-containing protein [Bacteroidota bacterium]
MKTKIGSLLILLVSVIGILTSSAQTITTVAGNGTYGYSGDGGPATAASFGTIPSIALDASGNLFIADEYNNRIRKVDNSTGVVTTFAGNGSFFPHPNGVPATSSAVFDPTGVKCDALGNLFLCQYPADGVREVTGGLIFRLTGFNGAGHTGDGGPAIAAADITPTGVAVDASGNVYFADRDDHTVREINTAGIISTICGIPGNGGYSGDGGPATSAQISGPQGLAVDAAGNLYIGDSGNNRIRKITTSTGIITTVAGNGNGGYSGDGGPATSATLNSPHGIAFDNTGKLYFADYQNNVVRKINASGVISTIAGNGTAGYSGDGGPALSAVLSWPSDVAVDASGNVYVSDQANFVVRKISAPAAPVPTLSEWGMILLSIVVLSMGVYFIKSKVA